MFLDVFINSKIFLGQIKYHHIITICDYVSMCYYTMLYLNRKKIWLIIYIKYISQITASVLQLKHSSDVVVSDKKQSL